MFCKNCGKELAQESLFCSDCGFKAGEGDKHCSHCGVSVQSGQSLCVACGFMLTQENLLHTVQNEEGSQNSQEKNPYKKYIDNIVKVKKTLVIKLIISVLLFVSLVFLPIFTYSYNSTTSDDVDENGTNEELFSLWDDFQICKRVLFEDKVKGSIRRNYFYGFYFAGSIVLVFLLNIMFFYSDIKKFYNSDNTVLLIINGVKKQGKKYAGLYLSNCYSYILFDFSMILVIIADLCFTKVFLSDEMTSIKPELYRYAFSFTGFSVLVWVIVALFLAAFVVSFIYLKQQKHLFNNINNDYFYTSDE